jgi:hypothetical protein
MLVLTLIEEMPIRLKVHMIWRSLIRIEPLKIDSTDARVYYNRGVAYYFKSKYGKSWEYINKAKELVGV